MGTLDDIRRIKCYDYNITYDDCTIKMIGDNYIERNMIYDKTTDLEEFYDDRRNEDIMYDEMYLVGDKREFIKNQENKMIHAINVYASHLNRSHVLIQNYQHIDFRLRDKALLEKYVLRRGEVYTFSEFKSALVQNTDVFAVDEQDRYMFNDPERLRSYLNHREGFIKVLNPPQLWVGDEFDFDPKKNKVDPLMVVYDDWKKYHQKQNRTHTV
jgi:hypothetical protein